MTYDELKLEVQCLGFETQIEDSSLFFTSVQRALGLIYFDLPEIKEGRIMQRRITPLSVVESVKHNGGEETTIPLIGHSYSFKASGKGEFTVTDGFNVRHEKFNSNLLTVQGFISSPATLTVSGESCHLVKDILCFEERFDTPAAVPTDLNHLSYDPKELFPDFLSLHSEITDKDKKPIKGARAVGDMIELPADFEGEAIIRYKAAPPTVANLQDDDTLKISRRHRELLPILTASFIWLDDDAEKASYYMSIYRSQLSSILRGDRAIHKSEYSVEGGWA